MIEDSLRFAGGGGLRWGPNGGVPARSHILFDADPIDPAKNEAGRLPLDGPLLLTYPKSPPLSGGEALTGSLTHPGAKGFNKSSGNLPARRIRWCRTLGAGLGPEADQEFGQVAHAGAPQTVAVRGTAKRFHHGAALNEIGP